MILKFIGKWVGAAWDGVYWMMMEMDITQWAIVSILFVISGFMALRTRI
jgi:hypothetical protein